jgi:hypothetical protein
MNTGENEKQFIINPETGKIDTQDISSGASEYEENDSFCRVGSNNGGYLEVDLRVTKQKGQEERFISVSVVGFNEENQIAKTEMFILDEEAFKKLQGFIAKLNWND